MKVSEFFVRRFPPKTGVCFVLMPFQEALTAVYEHGIKPQVESMGMQCRRADEVYSAQGILADTWDAIQTAEIIIADLTGKNPNVMYELGLCHALWKRVILLSQNKDDVPFDLRAWRVIWYDFTFAGATRLKEELARAIQGLRKETTTEAEPRELPSRALPSVQETPPVQEKWLHGRIEAWRSDRGFGFINVDGESFWFNADYLFSSAMIPTEGSKVVFMPLPPLANARHQRASRIFVLGTKLQGQVANVIKAKSCAFARVEGKQGDVHSLFVETGQDSSIVPGVTVEVIVGENRGGPTGIQVKVVTTESSPVADIGQQSPAN